MQEIPRRKVDVRVSAIQLYAFKEEEVQLVSGRSERWRREGSEITHDTCGMDTNIELQCLMNQRAM